MIAAAQAGNTDWDLFFAMDRGCTEAGAPPGGQQLLSTGPWRGRRSNVFFDGRTARTLRPGDVIVPEVTSNYKGYFTQLTVPVVLGEPSEQFLADLALCDAVYAHMLAKYRPGATVKGLDDQCAQFAKQASEGANHHPVRLPGRGTRNHLLARQHHFGAWDAGLQPAFLHRARRPALACLWRRHDLHGRGAAEAASNADAGGLRLARRFHLLPTPQVRIHPRSFPRRKRSNSFRDQLSFFDAVRSIESGAFWRDEASP